MKTENKPVLIEIPEDAYRQNTICRPLPVIKASEAGGRPDTPTLTNDSRQVVTES